MILTTLHQSHKHPPAIPIQEKNRLLVKKYHTFFAYSKKLSTFALANGNKTIKHGEIAQLVRASDS